MSANKNKTNILQRSFKFANENFNETAVYV